jgi:hypothetical protein
MPPGMTNYRCWDDNVQHYDDGTIECIISARINQFIHPPGCPDTEDPDHAFFFCRYDGTKWTPTYLCQAGYKLYSAEADYVGLGCLSPNDPNTIFISTRYDPRAVQPGVTNTNPPYSISVFMDDNAITVGTTSTLAGSTNRTWYDGVSYVQVERFRIANVAYNAGGSSATITWNSTPPELSLTTPTYTVWKKNILTDPTWSMVATGVPSGGAITSCVDTAANGNTAFYRVSIP